jgi:hypothetical protein
VDDEENAKRIWVSFSNQKIYEAYEAGSLQEERTSSSLAMVISPAGCSSFRTAMGKPYWKELQQLPINHPGNFDHRGRGKWIGNGCHAEGCTPIYWPNLARNNHKTMRIPLQGTWNWSKHAPGDCPLPSETARFSGFCAGFLTLKMQNVCFVASIESFSSVVSVRILERQELAKKCWHVNPSFGSRASK